MDSNLANWINPLYVEEFRESQISSRRCDSPFTYAILPNFFTNSALDRLLSSAARTPLEKSHRKGIAKNTDWYWGAFADLDFVRFFLGREMRMFLNALLATDIRIKPSVVPQYNVFNPKSPGLPIHTDMNESINLVTIIQLSQEYYSGAGGELVFYRNENNKLLPEVKIEPLCNTFILFRVCPHSFHGVNDMRGEWTRRTITYDWKTMCAANSISAL